MTGDILDCHNWGEGGCYWHVVGGSQGYCSTSHNAKDSPSTRLEALSLTVILFVATEGTQNSS